MLARPKRLLAPAIAALAVVTTPAIANGSTTVGQTLVTDTQCGGDTIDAFNTAVSSGTSYVVPADGVLTSWKTRTGADGSTMRLKAYRATGTANQYTVVGASALETTPPNTTGQHSTRIPVKAGDIIGIGGALGDCYMTVPASNTYEGRESVDAPAGETDTYQAFPNPIDPTSLRTDISATLEPDADGDGFGDETQDACPTDASTQGACPTDLSIAKTGDRAIATLGRHITYTLGVKNNSGSNTATGVMVTDALPGNLTLVSTSASQGTCVGATCLIGSIAKGATAKVTVVANAVRTGSARDSATVSSSTPDPNSANNTASVTTPVAAPFVGVALPSQTLIPDSHGVVTLAGSCPAAAVGNCAGTDTLRTAGKVTPKLTVARKRSARLLTLGRGRYSIAPGHRGKIRIKLSRTALKLLARQRTLNAVQIASSHDARKAAVRTTGRVTLKAR